MANSLKIEHDSACKMEKRKRILVVSSFSPEKENRVGPSSLLTATLESLEEGGYSFDFLQISQPDKFLKKKMFQLGFYRGDKVRCENYSAVLVYPYWCIGALSHDDHARCVCIAPDLQSQLFRRLSLNNKNMRKIVFSFASNLFRYIEHKYFHNLKSILFVGASDQVEYFCSNNRNGMYVPHPVTNNTIGNIVDNKTQSRQKIVLFSGAGGNRYFGDLAYQVLREISRHDSSDNISIYILGLDKKQLYFQAKEMSLNVTFFDWIESYSKLFLDYEVVQAIPLVVGSGTKNRLLESVAYGATVVTTSVGAENCEDLVDMGVVTVADCPREFSNKIIDSYFSSAGKLASANIRNKVFSNRNKRFSKAVCDSLE